MRTLSFSVTCASTRPGQSVGVAGSWSTWRPAGDFSGAAFPQWTGLVEVPDTGDPLEYKYVIVERGDVVRWEETASGRNRVLAAPADAAGGEPVQVDDGRFGGEHPTAVTAPPPPPPPPLRGGRGGGGGGSRFLDSAEVAALDTFEAALVDMNSAKKSWRLRLAFVRSAFCDPAFARQVQFDPTSVDCLVTVSAYLSFLASGQVPCAEDDGHHRPNHNAMEALQIEQALDAIVPPAAGPDGDETAVSWAPFVARSIYPQLPSHASQFTASVPLTRIRDIAHRGDIPHEMKQEIKHTLQNKIHRCCGPEDIRTCEQLLHRVRRGGYSADFVHQLGVFYDELREFFNASSLDDRLRHLESGTAGQSAVENAGRLLRLKQGGKPPWDQLAALTDLRDQLSAILAASRGAAGGEAAAALPAEVLQKVRLADIELDSYAFTLLAAVAKDVEGRGLSSAQGWRFALSALGYGMRNMHASQILGPETLAAATELAALASQGSVDLLRVKAAVDRARRATEDFSAAITDAHVRRVLSLSAALGVDRRSAAVFAEAVVRSTVAFQSSRIADAATRCARDALGIPPWDPLFNGSARGKVVFADALGDVRQSPECVIAVCRTADGDEDVPKNVRGVVLGHAIPHLSHLGVRARQSGVVFVCAESRPAFDAVWSGTARSFQSDAQLLVTPAAGFASLAEVASAHGPSRSTPAPHAAVGGKANGALIDIGKIDASETGVLPLTRATAANSSAKCTFAGRLAAIAGEPQALFAVPGGVCIPFGVYKAAERPHRAAVGELMAEYDAVVAGDEQAAAGVAQRLREFIDGNFAVSDQVVAAVQGALPGDAVRVMVRSSANCEDLEGMSGAGLYDSIANVPVSDAPQLAAAVRRVWASLWTRRAASSRGAYSVAHSSACMATLVQRMVEAEVSFVAFSHNPVDSSDCGHVYIELAVGMGETLASGGVAGQPYRLRVSRQQPDEVTVDALASYGCALVPLSPGARVKSASGLRRRVVDYSTQRMTTDAALRAGIASRIARVILKLEAELGGAQDVEGAVTGLGDARSAEGVSLFVVQARPQVSNSL